MKKIIIFLMLLIIPIKVYAADNECTYNTRVELNKEAQKVTASYEFINDDLGNVTGFKISVYNLTNNLALAYSVGSKKSDSTISVPFSEISENGTYTFDSYNLNTVITYKFIIKANANNCFNNLRTITLVKPMKNSYADMAICGNQYLEKDYYYCREWLTTPITLKYADVVKKINDEIARKAPTTTTACLSCRLQDKKNSINSDFKKVKTYIIIGLSIGIVLDTIVLILSIKRARDDIF